MIRSRMLVPLATLMLAACGGGGDEDAAAERPTTDTVTATSAVSDAPPAPAGTVDTAGVGTNPPTAGGQLVDSAAVPGPTDTVQGTATAP
jgi:hypothetical protein